MATVAGREFAVRHEWDRLVWPGLLALTWFGLLMGFVPEVVGQVRAGKYDYPIVTHIHAAAFVAWMLLFTAQMTFVRTGQVARHRQLGQIGGLLVPVMVVLGLVTAVVSQQRHFGTADSDVGFFAIPAMDMIVFAILTSFGLSERRSDPAAHRRLMMLATIGLADAGYGRWLTPVFEGMYGKTLFAEWAGDDLMVTAMVAAMGVYDLVTRGRLHPAYIGGATLLVGCHFLSHWLWLSSWWPPMVVQMLGLS